MKRLVNHRLLVVMLVGGLILLLIPGMAGAVGLNGVGVPTAKLDPPGKWIDEITNMVRDHKDLAKFEGREVAYDPYLGELAVIRAAFNAGDTRTTYLTMNHLMDMLEADANGGGIPKWSAKAIFDFCGRITPVKYHDVTRHTPRLSKGGFDFWADEVPDFGGGG